MALRVVAATPPTGMYMSVKVQGDAYDDLQGAPARDLAKQYCQSQGFLARGLANMPTIYPVNDTGEATEKVAFGLEKRAAFESEFRFSTGI
jgi:hypothetical protein